MFNSSKVLSVQLLLPLTECYEGKVFRALCFIGGLGSEDTRAIILLQLGDDREAATSERRWVALCQNLPITAPQGKLVESVPLK